MSDQENAKNQAKAQVSSIVEMVNALECDWDRLEELRDDRELHNESRKESGGELMPLWSELEESGELAELEEKAGQYENEDAARTAILNDPLSVEVRSGWHGFGEKMEAEEFKILLCTGGPAVRLIGELDEHNQPCNIKVQYQDWFTPWTDLDGITRDQSDALITYCRQFYFGDC